MSELRTKPVDKITFQDVQEFCALQLREHIRLDYKRELPSQDAIAKVLSAFANTQGGHAIFGVGEVEDKDGIPEPAPEGRALGKDPYQAIRSACSGAIWPPISPEISPLIENPAAKAKGFVVVRVPMSDQVPHTVEGKRGVYVRVVDNSEPLAATIDQIAFMLSIRDKATGRQASRRSDAAGRLGNLTQTNRRRGYFTAVVGPRISTEALFKLTDLRAAAESICLPAGMVDRLRPFVHPENLIGVLDGVAAIADGRKTATLLDVFGNVAVFENILSNSNTDRIDPSSRNRFGYSAGSAGMEVSDSRSVVSRLLIGLNTAREYYSKVGFTGPLTASIAVDGIVNVPLIHWTDPYFEILGKSPADTSIRFDHEFEFEPLRQGIEVAAHPLVERLLWAWGCAVPDKADAVLRGAMAGVFGAKRRG